MVDDGSRDDTTAVMQALCASHPALVYLKLSRNFGKEAALTAGIDATRGDVVVMMDADGQHPSNLLADMLPSGARASTSSTRCAARVTTSRACRPA